MSIIEIIKSFIPLILIFGLLFGVLILVKKYSFSLNGKKTNLLNINVLFNQMILPKKYLSVVRVENKLLVLGISENNISLLKEIDYNPAQQNEINIKDNKPNFINIFKQNLGMK
jgi:flagellar protein FliO/FliZ